jgi:hypothetical protein
MTTPLPLDALAAPSVLVLGMLVSLVAAVRSTWSP